jgi:hypothetical protein
LQDLNDLQYFAQVVRHGGFSAAWCATHEPRSELSQRVTQLERWLGVRLSRGSRGRLRGRCRLRPAHRRFARWHTALLTGKPDGDIHLLDISSCARTDRGSNGRLWRQRQPIGEWPMGDKWTEISSEAYDHSTFMVPVPGGALIRHVEKSDDGDVAVSVCFVLNAEGNSALQPSQLRLKG